VIFVSADHDHPSSVDGTTGRRSHRIQISDGVFENLSRGAAEDCQLLQQGFAPPPAGPADAACQSCTIRQSQCGCLMVRLWQAAGARAGWKLPSLVAAIGRISASHQERFPKIPCERRKGEDTMAGTAGPARLPVTWSMYRTRRVGNTCCGQVVVTL
jgi:hypothetical protein